MYYPLLLFQLLPIISMFKIIYNTKYFRSFFPKVCCHKLLLHNKCTVHAHFYFYNKPYMNIFYMYSICMYIVHCTNIIQITMCVLQTCALISEPKSSNSLTVVVCPFIAASIRGDIPSLLPVLKKKKHQSKIKCTTHLHYLPFPDLELISAPAFSNILMIVT